MQADGKILVAGYTYNGTIYEFGLVRYNTDGSLDTTFDTDGKVTTAMGTSYSYGNDVTVQSDGKILVVGYANSGGNDLIALVRYNTNGSLDTSFDGDGKVTTSVGTGGAYGQSVTVQADGKILVAGDARRQLRRTSPWSATTRTARSTPASTPTARSRLTSARAPTPPTA